MTRRYNTKTNYTQIGDLKFNLEYFYSHQETQPNGCIHWTGGKHRQGYGMIGGKRESNNGNFMTVTHRLVAMIKLNRELAKGENVMHTCSNPLCVNPDHIVVGDLKLRNKIAKDNGRPMGGNRGRAKGSMNKAKQNREYRYTDEEMRFVRDTKDIAEITKRFNITRQRAYSWRHAIRHGYNWLDVNQDK